MTDLEILNIVSRLIKSPLTSYYIAKKTGITEQSILNYRKKKTIPTQANAKLLEYFFNNNIEISDINTSKNNITKTNITGNNNGICNNNLSDMITLLIKKDEQIDKLLTIIDKLSQKYDDCRSCHQTDQTHK